MTKEESEEHERLLDALEDSRAKLLVVSHSARVRLTPAALGPSKKDPTPEQLIAINAAAQEFEAAKAELRAFISQRSN